MRVGTLLNVPELVPELANHYFRFKPERRRDYSQTFLNIARIFLCHRDLRASVEELLKAGTRHIEISGDLVFISPEFKSWWKKQLPYLISLQRKDITFSVHLPQFSGLFIDSYSERLHNAAVEDIREIYEFFKDLDPIHVLHLGSERFFRYTSAHFGPSVGNESKRICTGKRLNWLKAFIVRIAAKKGLQFVTKFITREVIVANLLESLQQIQKFMPLEKLCIENLEYTDLDSIMCWIPEEVRVGVTIDTGHLIIQKWENNKQCFEQFMARHGHRLRSVHIHEVIRVADVVYNDGTRVQELQDHKPLGIDEGILQLRKVLRLIRKVELQHSREIPVVLELYYYPFKVMLDSVRILKEEIDRLQNDPA
ncbi:MAG: TIM barrel protein [Patescibacteria group bacterium]